MDEAEIDHTVSAFYSNGPYGLQPAICCSCGWEQAEPSWQEVGAAYDEHLKVSAATGPTARGAQE